MTEELQRIAVRDQARSWVATPYAHKAAIKGVGVDCAMILREVFADAGLIERFDPGHYTREWYLHRDEERYLEAVERFAGKPLREGKVIDWVVEGYQPLTGDILVWRVGRTFAHGAIVTEWPYAVHASAPAGIVEEVCILHSPVYERLAKHYSIWGPR